MATAAGSAGGSERLGLEADERVPAPASAATASGGPPHASTVPASGFDWLVSGQDSGPKSPTGRGRIGDRLCAAGTPVEAFSAWAALRIGLEERPSRSEIGDRLAADIAAIDQAIATQLDAILHAPRFQQLESSWRSLHWLVHRAGAGGSSPGVKVRVLNASKRELARDFERAVDFDRSVAWREIYDQQFDMPGGEPFGLLVADFELGAHPEDQELLAALAGVAAASFAPLVAAPQADLLGLDSMADIDRLPPLDTLHGGVEFAAWRSLRSSADARFVGLVLPRVLARLPYDGWVGGAADAQAEATWSRRGFPYRERVDGPGFGHRLWASAAWAFAAVVIAEFERSGWFADIRGGSRGAAGGGVVEGLPVEGFAPPGGIDASRGPLDVQLSAQAEVRLADAGFVPLVADGGPGRALFHSNQSLHRPARYQSAVATANEKISSMLQYMLCVSRFAHHLKQLGRDKVGAHADAESLRRTLADWLKSYVTPDDSASPATRAQMPLRAAELTVREDPAGAGAFRLEMQLQPHFQLDEIEANVRFVTSLRSR